MIRCVCSVLCDPFGDLVQGHLTALNTRSDDERSLHQHCKVDKRRYEENNCNYLNEGSGHDILLRAATHCATSV